VALAPIDAPRLTLVWVIFHSPTAFGYLSFVKVTAGPMKTPSAISTPDGMKTALYFTAVSNLHSLPDLAERGYDTVGANLAAIQVCVAPNLGSSPNFYVPSYDRVLANNSHLAFEP
jgi:hypothetical protein